MTTEDRYSSQKSIIEKFEREIVQYLSQEIRQIVSLIDKERLNSLEEIRLRAYKPIMLLNSQGDWFIDKNGNMVRKGGNLCISSQEDIIRTLGLMSENSIYAYQDEIRNGFITLKGGHRVGIAGKVVLDDDGVKNIKDISGLNIRISREVSGCSAGIIKYIISRNEVLNTLIISPPQCGKTTLLRDMARVISDGMDHIDFKGLKVGIVDERSEIAACYRGVAQNNVGIRTDILDGCPKSIGMALMIRAMSPQVIVTDEIGNQGDRDAVMSVLNAGVKIITTAHGYNISELQSRKEVLCLIEQRVFERYIVLDSSNGPGTVKEIIDGRTMGKMY